jgi:hypothetical protein
MKRTIIGISALLVVVVGGFELLLADDSDRYISVPESIVSGQEFVVAMDTTGCVNKQPSVSWSLPIGCVITSGQGSAVAKVRCLGGRGTSVKISATLSGGRPPASCGGAGVTSTVIAGGDQSVPSCSSASTVPISTAKISGQFGTVRISATECIEDSAPVGCSAPTLSITSSQVAAMIASAESQAPADIKPYVMMVKGMPNQAGAFSSLIQAVHCLSPAPAPVHPENVSGDEVKSWLLDTVLRDGSPLSGFKSIVSGLSPESCAWAYRIAVVVKRGK